MRSYFFILILTIASLSLHAQDAVNQFDAHGERHGVWRKYFNNTKQLRYEGQFEHGKEIGTFKFYRLNKGQSVLSAIKTFNKENDLAVVKFLSSKGKLISEGQMSGKDYIGKWVYYHNENDEIMTVEYYNDQGRLDGERVVYYPNGNLAEKSNYNNGVLEGASTWYTEQGKVLKAFNYKNGELHGESKYYDTDGKILAEGSYRDGLKHGIWNYYEDGKLVETKDHTKRSKNPKKQ